MNISINFDGRSFLLAVLLIGSLGVGVWGAREVQDSVQTINGIEELKASAEAMKTDSASVPLFQKLLLGAVGMGMQLNPQLLEDLEEGARSQRRIGLVALLVSIAGIGGVGSAWQKTRR